jgi:GNAT superfamily N-acetyltransferase
MIIREVTEPIEKAKIVRTVLEALPDWFGVSESREAYIRESRDRLLYAAYDKDIPVGFICLKETGKDTAELSVLGVLKEYHRKGIGRELFLKAKEAATRKGYSFLQVKTVRMGMYDDYDDTNRFYLALGFKEFEVFPLLWDEQNPCQIYVMSLK